MKQHNQSNKLRLLAGILLVFAACNNEHKPVVIVDTATDSSAIAAPKLISYDIINAYPHEWDAFTEGLEFRSGVLYESVGQYGYSDLRRCDLKTGKILASAKLDAKYFGEGFTILHGKIYMLTYREGKGFVYDSATMKLEKTFTFSAPEGWGMTNNGRELIYDDGSNILHFVDPATFKETRQLAVRDDRGPVKELNELEMIHGYIYANQWRSDLILKIDTATGMVVARADLSSIHDRTGINVPSGKRHEPDVLNGIAYDEATNRIFITGKNWPKVFEVKLDN